MGTGPGLMYYGAAYGAHLLKNLDVPRGVEYRKLRGIPGLAWAARRSFLNQIGMLAYFLISSFQRFALHTIFATIFFRYTKKCCICAGGLYDKMVFGGGSNIIAMGFIGARQLVENNIPASLEADVLTWLDLVSKKTAGKMDFLQNVITHRPIGLQV